MVKQFFHAERPAEIHVHGRQVIHPIGVWNPLSWCEVFPDFFGTAMEIPDVWFNLGNDFTVGSQNEPQYPVGTGMLGAHVDQHFISANIKFNDSLIVLNLGCHRLLSSSQGYWVQLP